MKSSNQSCIRSVYLGCGSGIEFRNDISILSRNSSLAMNEYF